MLEVLVSTCERELHPLTFKAVNKFPMKCTAVRVMPTSSLESIILLAGRLLPWSPPPNTTRHFLELRKERTTCLHRWMRIYGQFLARTLFGHEGDGSISSEAIDPASASRTPALFARVLDFVFVPLLRLGLVSPRVCSDSVMLLSTISAALLLETHKAQWRNESLGGPEPMSASVLSFLSPFNPIVLGCACSVLRTGHWWLQQVMQACTGHWATAQTQIFSPSALPQQLRSMLHQHRHACLQLPELPETVQDCDEEGRPVQEVSAKSRNLSVWERLHMMFERSPVDRVALLDEAERRVADCAEVRATSICRTLTLICVSLFICVFEIPATCDRCCYLSTNIHFRY